ncbi:MAG: 16S rRNA (guanine(527)-N(7))-methyltransferase RsmG [Acidobacteria bacterium]|nr:16S rRNA (guanine(527)-N(7))-methyltransferase RsmG [Acidobacteriota bacterium]
MDILRIADLLQPFLSSPLSAPQLENISTYVDLLLRWNARMNLTAVRDPEEILSRHFGESLFAAQSLFPSAQASAPLAAIDVGSGAGFPGLPIKIWLPQISLTLLEANHKKVAFLREVGRALTLTNINVFHGRAEAFSTPAELVTLRAVERFSLVLPVARRLVAPAGRLALLIGEAQVKLAEQGTADITWEEPHPLPRSNGRVLLIGTALQNLPG